MKETNIQVRILYDADELKFSKVFLQHPLSVCLKVTNRCNFKCAHCLSSRSPDESPELTTFELMSVMDLIKHAGVPRINISGGEPFKREDIGDLLIHAKRVGFEVSVTTNGSLVKDEHVKLMKNLEIVPDISLDAPTEDLNDELRYKGSYAGAVNLIRRLKLAGVSYILNCTIRQQNFKKFDDFVKFGLEHKCRKIYAIVLRPQGKAKGIDGIQIKDNQIHILSDKVERYKKEFRDENNNISIDLMDLRRYPKSFVLIEPDGRVIAQSHEERENLEAGNLLIIRDLNSIWQQHNSFNHTGHLLHYIKG